MKLINLIFASILLLTVNDSFAQSPTFTWAKAMGGPGADIGSAIALDASGNIYTTGFYDGGTDFDPGAGTYNLPFAGGFADIYVSKLDASGNFVWAKAMSGTNTEEGISIALDGAGNVYTTGYFQGTVDFDPGAGIFNLTSSGGGFDIFISKLDTAGNFVWAKAMVGTNSENGNSIALDASGNVYTTGYFNATVDFDPGAGIYNLTSAGGADIFISKLDAGGNFVWAKRMGETNDDKGMSIVLDASGNVFTTGTFRDTADFDPGVATFNLISAGFENIYISKLDAAGNFVWAKAMGGGRDIPYLALALDASGNIFTTGFYFGTADFDPGSGTFNLSSAGLRDIFISKLNAAGDFVWAKSMGGISEDEGLSIAVDASGNVYTTGQFQATVDFDPGAATFNLTSEGADDIVILKLDAAGNFVWAQTMGGTTDDICSSITLDALGNIFTTGYFGANVDFDPGAGTFNLTSAGSFDIFVHKMADLSIGIVENNAAPVITIFPNPVSGIFTLSLSTVPLLNTEIRLINTMGQVIYTGMLESKIKQFDFSYLPAATYYMLITHDRKQIGKPVIITK